jgi:hypothetical protein
MVRALIQPALVAFALAVALAGCSSGPVIDRLPGGLGLPADAPARPTTPYQYPAVHDMPPPRATKPMTDEELLKAEKDLQAARDRQEGRDGPTKKAASAPKKKPAGAKNDQTSGAGTSP